VGAGVPATHLLLRTALCVGRLRFLLSTLVFSYYFLSSILSISSHQGRAAAAGGPRCREHVVSWAWVCLLSWLAFTLLAPGPPPARAHAHAHTHAHTHHSPCPTHPLQIRSFATDQYAAAGLQMHPGMTPAEVRVRVRVRMVVSASVLQGVLGPAHLLLW